MSLILFGHFPDQEPTATKEGRFITKDGRVIFIGGPGSGGGSNTGGISDEGSFTPQDYETVMTIIDTEGLSDPEFFEYAPTATREQWTGFFKSVLHVANSDREAGFTKERIPNMVNAALHYFETLPSE